MINNEISLIGKDLKEIINGMSSPDWFDSYNLYLCAWKSTKTTFDPSPFWYFKKYDYVRSLRHRQMYEEDLCGGNLSSRILMLVIGDDEYLGIYHSARERYESVFGFIDPNASYLPIYLRRPPPANL